MHTIHTKRKLRCISVIAIFSILIICRGLLYDLATWIGVSSFEQKNKILEDQPEKNKLRQFLNQTNQTNFSYLSKDILKDFIKQHGNNKTDVAKQSSNSGVVRQNENATYEGQNKDKDIVKQITKSDIVKENSETTTSVTKQNNKSSVKIQYRNGILDNRVSVKVKDDIGENDTSYKNIANASKSVKVEEDKKEENRKRVLNKHGLQLADEVRHACALEKVISKTSTLYHYIYDDRTLYCPVEKVGTTFWRRIVYIFSSKNPAHKFPFDVPEEFAHIQVKKEFSKHASSPFPKTAFSFLFVRNPFSRLLSAYIDKIVAPNPYYWREFGNLAIKRYRTPGTGSYLAGHSITLAEFMKLVIDVESTTLYSDPHVKSMDNSCNPCLLNYSFVGRMETFKDDALYVLKKLNTKQDIVKSIEKEWKELTVEAAIKFNIEYCFNSKKAIMTYITWEKALQRLWLHLQMRGIISKKIKLNHPDKNINTLNAKDFVDLAVKANKASDKLELKNQKLEVQREAFASIDVSYLEKYVKVFRKDFELFGYDSHPSLIFQRDTSNLTPQYFNYSHLN